MMAKQNKDTMSVRKAGHQGGEKGGRTVANKYDREHFQETGKKGGEKVSRLVEQGKQRNLS